MIGYLGLGSNVGDRRENLQAAVAALPGRGVKVLASSSGTRFPCVQESVTDLLMRGAEAVVRQPKKV